MSSVECLRDLINERLTAAAEEIFIVFQKTIVEYEEEIDRQRRLLDIVRKPEIKLHRTDLPEQHVCKEEEVPADQQLCNQERNCSLDQEDPEPPQIKEEQEELCTSLEGEQLVLKQETETFMSTSACEESEDQTLGLSPDETRNAEPKPQKTSNSHTNSEYNSTTFKIHSKQSLKCDTCEKTFEYKFKLIRHQRIHTREKSYSCETCGKSFRFNCGLLVHMRTHTGEKPYLCNTCGKNFSNKSILRRHMRIHTGKKPHICNTCGKNFSDMSGLKRHMRTHTGEKPHICNTCGKHFSYMSVLNRHMRIHTGEKPYNCKTCGKDFRIKCDLTVHIRRYHTGEKPHNCNICGKSFFRMLELKRHMRIHTDEESYSCQT